ncbi:MAG: hypothetical protein ACP5SH_26400 [Syntrophobacteraceae bacterium]
MEPKRGRKSFADLVREKGQSTLECLDKSKEMLNQYDSAKEAPEVSVLRPFPDLSGTEPVDTEHEGSHVGNRNDEAADPAEESKKNRGLIAKENIADSTPKGTLQGIKQDSLTDTPVSRLPNESLGEQHTGQSKEHSKEHSGGHSTEHTSEQSNEHRPPVLRNNEFGWMTHSQRTVLYFLVSQGSGVTQLEDIVRNTKVPYGTVRKVLEVLVREKLISKPVKYRKGNQQGLSYTLNEALCRRCMSALGHSKSHSTGHTEGQSDERSNERALQRADYGTLPYILDDDDSVGRENHHLRNPDLADIYPSLFESGLRSEHLAQVTKAWNLNRLNLMELHDSLEKAEWDVRENGSKMDRPLGYVLKALKNGSYTAPKGFKLRRQIQAEESARVARELRDLAEKEIEDRFFAWWTALSSDEKNDIDAKIGRGNKGFAILSKDSPLKEEPRKEYFRENIYRRSDGKD